MIPLIDAAAVERVLEACLWDDGAVPANPPVYDAIIVNFSFDPAKVEKHRAQISAWLSVLPDNFHISKGGGWSFLNACVDCNGVQWGEHRNMGMLFALGQATGQVRFVLPREMWHLLPGSMPYICIDITGKWAK